MTAQDLFRCIGNLSDTMLEEAADIRRKKRWLRMVSARFCETARSATVGIRLRLDRKRGFCYHRIRFEPLCIVSAYG